MEKNNKNPRDRIKNFYQKLDSVEKIESYFWQKSLRLLQKRAYSQYELSQKLLQIATKNLVHFNSEIFEKIIATIIKKLQNYNYLNDESFTKTNLYSKAYKYGNQRLVFDLQQKGISQEIIDENIAEFKENEFQRCLDLYSKKFKNINEVSANFENPNTQKIKAKQIRFLVNRGFSLNIIYKVLEECHKNNIN